MTIQDVPAPAHLQLSLTNLFTLVVLFVVYVFVCFLKTPPEGLGTKDSAEPSTGFPPAPRGATDTKTPPRSLIEISGGVAVWQS